MINIIDFLKKEFQFSQNQTENAVKLRQEGGTIPFIARYRKEMTGGLDENQLRDLFDRYDYIDELEKRKESILAEIDSQGKLTDELRKQLENCFQKTELEDLYLPYKPKKRTRATQAKEKGLEPLALFIKSYNIETSPIINIDEEANKYINVELGVNSTYEAIAGASDIIAEEIAEEAFLRQWIRGYISQNALYKSEIKAEFEKGTTKFENYREFTMPINKISSHNLLALRRGETEGILNLTVDFDTDVVLNYIENKIVNSKYSILVDFYKAAIKDGFARLMKNSIIAEVRLENKKDADIKSILVFEENLRNMLLASPAGMKPTLAIDPGFRTGCKACIINNTGKFIEYKQIFPIGSAIQTLEAEQFIISKVKQYNISMIAIGNGTAGRETEQFVKKVLDSNDLKPIVVMVNEAGASIYSASKLANEEFPDLDLTVRGAISIGRRLQDPLAELVKIDPKSIGVGQYQHDVDQKLLKKKLEESVESCVNYVGVDVNTASKELLTYVSGITSKLAENIVKYRDENGAFQNRKQLKKIAMLGPKAFELSAGFLRIRNGENILDNTAVHPESYHIVESIAKDLNISLNDINQIQTAAPTIEIKKYVNDAIGEPTLKDIIEELKKPGRDPRQEFKYAQFDDTIKTLGDLKTGMLLEGIVTNVTNFGAFVDIGVHQDGLVHKSQISHEFVSDPTKVIKVGQIVKVKVTDVDLKLNRVQLSMKIEPKPQMKRSEKNKPNVKEFSMDDLKAKFNNN